MVTMVAPKRLDVTAAALIEIDAELARLAGQARGAADLVDREFARLRIDTLLDRRLRLSARHPDTTEDTQEPS